MKLKTKFNKIINKFLLTFHRSGILGQDVFPRQVLERLCDVFYSFGRQYLGILKPMLHRLSLHVCPCLTVFHTRPHRRLVFPAVWHNPFSHFSLLYLSLCPCLILYSSSVLNLILWAELGHIHAQEWRVQGRPDCKFHTNNRQSVQEKISFNQAFDMILFRNDDE